MIEIKIGDTFGLWKVISEPSLSIKGNVTAKSKCLCVCNGCEKEFNVMVRHLLSGKSKGCVSCRASKNIKKLWDDGKINPREPSKGNPVCPKCLTNMARDRRKSESKEPKKYKCKCGESAIKLPPLCEPTKMMGIKIGDVFGLWKVVGEPSLSTKGIITSESKCPCVCIGVGCRNGNKEFKIAASNLVNGESKSCRSCAGRERHKRMESLGIKVSTSKPNPNNPLCPKCLINMKVSHGKFKTEKGTHNYYKCSKCSEKTKKFVPLSEQN